MEKKKHLFDYYVDLSDYIGTRIKNYLKSMTDSSRTVLSGAKLCYDCLYSLLKTEVNSYVGELNTLYYDLWEYDDYKKQ